MNKTTIEWTDYTWNPVTGCDKVSAGCRSCYAETLAKRFWGERKFTDVIMHEDRLGEPYLNRKKWAGKKVFVCSTSDLFHESVSFQFMLNVLMQIERCPDTTFQIPTKRPERALEYIKWRGRYFEQHDLPGLKNLVLIVSIENQEQADKRIPLILQIPGVTRGLSCEPLIGPIDLSKYLNCAFCGWPKNDHRNKCCYEYSDESEDYFYNDRFFEAGGIHWVIAGGESGHMARPMHPDWPRSLRDQCKAANVPFFFKQWGAYLPEWEESNDSNAAQPRFEIAFKKVGKSKSGNMLDGRTHLEFPSIMFTPSKTLQHA